MMYKPLREGKQAPLFYSFCFQGKIPVDVIEIYRLLPKIDCGQCSAKSCMAFARGVSEDREVLPECASLTSYGLMLIEALFSRGQ